MKNIIHILIILLLPTSLFGEHRPIDINEEIKSAKYVGEIIFTGYDSIKISRFSKWNSLVLTDSITGKEYSDTTYSDSVWNILKIKFDPIYHIDKSVNNASVYATHHSWNYYIPRPDTMPKNFPSNGFWPRIGDTCLVIIDSLGKVSLFAALIDNEYIFWDPYPNSGQISIIAFDLPFRHYPEIATSNFKLKTTKSIAEKYNRESACYFHCAINKEQFWKKVINCP